MTRDTLSIPFATLCQASNQWPPMAPKAGIRVHRAIVFLVIPVFLLIHYTVQMRLGAKQQPLAGYRRRGA